MFVLPKQYFRLIRQQGGSIHGLLVAEEHVTAHHALVEILADEAEGMRRVFGPACDDQADVRHDQRVARRRAMGAPIRDEGLGRGVVDVGHAAAS